VLVAFGLLLSRPVSAENWPAWRGPRLDGTSLETGVPTHWSTASNKVWKTELPGAVHASPAVSRRELFLRGDRHLICIGIP